MSERAKSDSAREAGYRAFYEGVPLEKNPMRARDSRQDWSLAWRAAQQKDAADRKVLVEQKKRLSKSSELNFVQSARWCRNTDGGTGVYDQTRCAYCYRPVRQNAALLRTARTNDGEWWLISTTTDLSDDKWRDFQSYPEGRRPTLLPIGSDCLRQHPEFEFALASR